VKYDLKIQRSAQKSLAKISEPFKTNIINRIYALADDPYYNAKNW